MRLNARVGKLLGVAVLYSFGGAMSPFLSDWGERFCKWFALNPMDVLTPLAFALISAVLFLRSWKAVPAVALNCAAWVIAHRIAVRLAESGPACFDQPYFGSFFVAGFAGALGVALADSICHPRLLVRRRLGSAAFIGALAGLSFGFLSGSGAEHWGMPCAFAIWQASVGTYLYSVCTPRHAGSAGGAQAQAEPDLH